MSSFKKIFHPLLKNSPKEVTCSGDEMRWDGAYWMTFQTAKPKSAVSVHLAGAEYRKNILDRGFYMWVQYMQ